MEYVPLQIAWDGLIILQLVSGLNILAISMQHTDISIAGAIILQLIAARIRAACHTLDMR